LCRRSRLGGGRRRGRRGRRGGGRGRGGRGRGYGRDRGLGEPERRTAVRDSSIGSPVCGYFPFRESVSVTSGEPVSSSFVPAAGGGDDLEDRRGGLGRGDRRRNRRQGAELRRLDGRGGEVGIVLGAVLPGERRAGGGLEPGLVLRPGARRLELEVEVRAGGVA